MENNTQKSGAIGKMKIFGIGAVIVVILAAAFLTALGFLQKNNLKYGGRQGNLSMPEMMTGDRVASPSLGVDSVNMKSANGVGVLEASPNVSDTAAAPAPADKRVIKTGNLTLKVDRIDDAQEKISSIAKENGGDVFSSNIYQSGAGVKSGNVTVKVPAANFEKTFAELKTTASLVVRESTAGQDVTEQYQDLETQIKNKQAEEDAYKKILDQAQKIDDILAITRQVSATQGQIESLQGQLKYMQARTDMSTINVNMSEDQNITMVDSWRPLQIAKDAINSLVKSSQNFVSFLIILVIVFLPTAVLYLLVAWILLLIGRKIYRKLRKKNQDR